MWKSVKIAQTADALFYIGCSVVFQECNFLVKKRGQLSPHACLHTVSESRETYFIVYRIYLFIQTFMKGGVSAEKKLFILIPCTTS